MSAALSIPPSPAQEALETYPIGTKVCLRVWSDAPLPFLAELRRLPGARWESRRGRRLLVPGHGWCYLAYGHPDPEFREMVQKIPVVRVDRPGPVPPADPLAELLQSEFKTSVLRGRGGDGFETFNAYQRALVAFAGRRNGGSAWMSPGCLTGDAMIVVNRAGAARAYRLNEIVTKFNGGTCPNPRTGQAMGWRASIPTRTASLDESGFLRLNEILGAVSSGVRAVFQVEVETGQRLKATACHRFWTGDEWVALGDLRPGDTVYVRQNDHAVPRKITAITPAGEEPTYDLQMHAPHSSFVANDFVVHNSGKTRATLAWGLLPRVTDRSPAGLLVVTPASVRLQWAAEAVACADVHPWISDPDLAQRKSWLPPLEYAADCMATGRRPLFIVGWEELARLYYGDAAHEGRAGERRARRKGGEDGTGRHGFLAELISWGTIVSVIWDEAQYGKSPKRFRWMTVDRAGKVRRRVSRGNTAAAAQEIAERVPRRLASTGTPASKDVLDFWGGLTLVEPDCWGGRKGFGMYHCGAMPTAYDIELPRGMHLGRSQGQEAGVELLSQSTLLRGLRTRLGVVLADSPPPAWGTVFVVRQEESHKHLPPKRRRVSYVGAAELDKVTAADLEACLKSSPGEDELLLPRGQEALVVMTALMKTSHIARRAAETLLEGGKVCVLTARQRHVDRLVEAIAKAAPGVVLWGLHGGNTTARERDEVRLQYLAAARGGAGICVVGTGATIGTGLNWQDTDRGILAMVPTTPAQLVQYENRWYRLGLTHPVEVLIPVALGTTDRVAISRLRSRLVEAGEVLDDPGLAAAAEALLGTDTPEELAAMMKATTEAMVERQARVEGILAEALAAVENEPFWL